MRPCLPSLFMYFNRLSTAMQHIVITVMYTTLLVIHGATVYTQRYCSMAPHKTKAESHSENVT